ncbi:LysR family transcriptional regulator [Pseudophaeobacter sp.]|uniref:LysR family transcriptional regulator n=1 Tax=Pseudophaeobacter sp. TaxID=1971739 RepID=UPI0032994E4C
MIKSQFTLKQLEALAFVVDTGTFRAAAVALGTTQPNISARIATLENALGTSLLTRDAGSVRLTAKGEVLLDKARTVLWAGEALIEAAGRQDLIEERLRLGVTELVACSWLRGFLRLLKEAYPKLRVELEVDLSTVIERRLIEGQLDLALQTGPFKVTSFASEPLGLENYCWVANPKLAKGLGTRPNLEALFQQTILTHAKHTQAGLALHQVAEQNGLETSQIVHSSALSACVPMVLEGLGVALLPEALVAPELKSSELRIVPCNWLPAPLTFFARYTKERAPLFVGRAAKLAVEAQQENSKDK